MEKKNKLLNYRNKQQLETQLSVKFQIDVVSAVLFLMSLGTRLYKLQEPR